MFKREKKFLFEEKMDMTPLIDVVFLLIMFFILTTQITMNYEDVQLPFALEGVTKEGPQEDITKVINVRLKEGRLTDRIGEIVYNGKVLDDTELVRLLQEEVDYDKAELGRNRAPEVTPEGRELSQLKVRIRADKRVRAEYLRKIFMACATVSPAIYKIEISSEQPSE